MTDMYAIQEALADLYGKGSTGDHLVWAAEEGLITQEEYEVLVEGLLPTTDYEENDARAYD